MTHVLLHSLKPTHDSGFTTGCFESLSAASQSASFSKPDRRWQRSRRPSGMRPVDAWWGNRIRMEIRMEIRIGRQAKRPARTKREGANYLRRCDTRANRPQS